MYIPEQSPPLLIKNEEVKDPEIVDNAFSTFFLTAVENSNLRYVRMEYAFLLSEDIFPLRFPIIKFNPTAETEIHVPSNKKLLRL
jgi:hypothetical protein